MTAPRDLRRATRTVLLVLSAATIVAVACAMLAVGSREIRTQIGDMPVNSQDEVRVGAEVWFTLAMAALAILTTVLWWRRGPWRGPLGLGLAAGMAAAQTGFGILVWTAVVAMRGFGTEVEVGAEHVKAPVISGTSSMWVAAVAATLTYIALVILAERSDLADPSRAVEDGGTADPAEAS